MKKQLCIYNNETLSIKKISIPITVISIAISIFITIGTWEIINKQYNIINNIFTESEVILIEIEPFSEEAFKTYLKDLNFKYPDLVHAQAKIESANFTSSVFNTHNNMFGMKKARARVTTADPNTEMTYAHYSYWKDAVLDRAMYECKYLSTLSRTQYIDYLNKNYAEDPNYDKALRSIVSK